MDGTLPTDPAYRVCLICGHEQVDEPQTNIVNLAANEALREKYVNEMAEFEQDQAAWKAKNNNKSSPKEPKYKAIVYQCHCHQMSCTGFQQGSCSECIANPPKSYGPNSECPCTICQCPCAAAVLVSDYNLLFHTEC